MIAAFGIGTAEVSCRPAHKLVAWLGSFLIR